MYRPRHGHLGDVLHAEQQGSLQESTHTPAAGGRGPEVISLYLGNVLHADLSRLRLARARLA